MAASFGTARKWSLGCSPVIQRLTLSILLLTTLFLTLSSLASREIVTSFTAGRKLSRTTPIPVYPFPEASHLIIVACHAIWHGYAGEHPGESATEWNLKPFQQDQQITFINHIQLGLNAAIVDEESLLVFSGGQTSRKSGPISEAQSYYNLANARKMIETDSNVSLRVTTEEFAKDSFENLLFSICRFHEFTGQYPDRITFVTHEFKRERIQGLHRAAIRFPLHKFRLIGRDAPGEDSPTGEEYLNALEPFTRDPYGCFDETLVSKRKSRNPFLRHDSYFDSCPELRGLLAFCSQAGAFYLGDLPWDNHTASQLPATA
ncbi:uncharacterized protein V1518DRAFT_411382 [Limtongia smithiae]|uniref:uncharacterized protein n=1 Tax=Limtongia smithiae TaxID=1125753 RepID=UPI0034CE2760